MEWKKKLVSVLMAIIGCIAARWAIPFPLEYSMSFIPLLVAVALYFAYKKGLDVLASMRTQPHWRRTAAVTAVAAVAFSAALVLGSWIACAASEGLSVVHLLAIVVNSFPLFVLAMMLWGWLDRRTDIVPSASSAPSTPPDGAPTQPIATSNAVEATAPSRWLLLARRAMQSRWWPAACFFVLLCCWLPVFLAAYPGFFCYDMSVGDYAEWTQFSNRELYSHHPVLHTLLMGTTIRVVADLTGSFNVGVAVFVGLQALVVARVFTYLLARLRDMTRSSLLCFGSLAYLALDPLVSMFVLCTTKDTLFSAFVVLFCVLLYGYMAKATHRGIEHVFALGLSATAICILRPNGLIAFIVALPFLLALAQRGTRIRLGSACAAALALSLIWLGPVAWALGVNETNLQRFNALSIPVQQLVHTYQDSATAEEKSWLESLGYQDECLYEPPIADAARWNVIDMPLPGFVEAYVAMGARYPDAYFSAFLQQTQMAWNPYSYVDIYHDRAYTNRETSLFGFDWESPAISQPIFPWLHDTLESISGKLVLQNIPVLALLASIPFCVWMLCLVTARSLITKNHGALAICVVFGLLALSALMGPCALVRYYLYLFFGLPLLAALLLLPKAVDEAS